MHELGIVMNVVEQVEQVAKQNNVKRVLQLNVEVGEVSAIVPDLFTDCFEWAKKRTEYLKDAQLNLIVLQGISYCRSCKRTYETTKYAKQCPHCQSMDTYLVTGNEINIKDIQVET